MLPASLGERESTLWPKHKTTVHEFVVIFFKNILTIA